MSLALPQGLSAAPSAPDPFLSVPLNTTHLSSFRPDTNPTSVSHHRSHPTTRARKKKKVKKRPTAQPPSNAQPSQGASCSWSTPRLLSGFECFFFCARRGEADGRPSGSGLLIWGRKKFYRQLGRFRSRRHVTIQSPFYRFTCSFFRHCPVPIVQRGQKYGPGLFDWTQCRCIRAIVAWGPSPLPTAVSIV